MTHIDEPEYTKSFSLKVWKRTGPYIGPQKKRVLAVIIIMSLCALCDIVIPLLQGYIIDHFIRPKTTEGLMPYILLGVGTVTFQAITVLFFIRTSGKVEMNFSRALRASVFTHLQKLGFSYYNTTPVGTMMARVMSDTGRIGEMFAWGMVDVCWSLVYCIGVFVSMFMLNWRLALIVGLTIPLISLLTYFMQTKILHLSRHVRRVNSRMTAAMNEGITGARTSKTLVIEAQNDHEFTGITGEYKGKATRIAFLRSVFTPIVMFIGAVAAALVLSAGGSWVLEGAFGVTIGLLTVFLSYATGIFEPIQQIAHNVSEFVAVQANLERVITLLDVEPDIQDSPEVVEKYGTTFAPKRENWEPLSGDIEFRDVTFRYPDGTENVLEHFNLTIPAGTYVAIVGETGAGKSTLVNLVCRFFEPTEGAVLIDGRDSRERSQLWLHSSIGYVLQSPHLFSGTVRENIRYGRLDATDDEIDTAARLVSADTVIAKLEQGMDSEVGEGGDRLSTGEKQLISFARAVLANPRIFVLDEATSSIDTETEALIQKAVAHLLKGRTSFVIAHRLSTVKTADVILVVKNGKIIERGTHRELLAAKGHYFELYTRQFEEDVETQVFG